MGIYIFYLMKYGDTTDIYAMIAPRPLLLMNKVNDDWFPISGFLEICEELERVYRTFEVPIKFRYLLSVDIHDIAGIYEEGKNKMVKFFLKEGRDKQGLEGGYGGKKWVSLEM